MENQAQERINLFIPIVLIIFLVSIFIVFNYMRGERDIESPVLESLVEEIPELTVAEIERKLEECKISRTIQQQDWCKLNLARSYRIDTCSEIVNTDSKYFCEAIIEKNVRKCDSIFANSLQDSCYITLATIVRDVSICRRSEREEFCRSLF